ncbi:MAG: nucleotidyl transferase AbiEii/AbiGii toxin family protein [Chloroflexi bacterium]|nr:nucleotidyl transferase AbiEii/AbiGii toxin family protein [Chloroflexota bacterium]
MAEPPSILTPLQRDFLNAFFIRPAAQKFFLTGGTALAAFHLHHRYSEDLDLFTLDWDALEAMELEMPVLASEIKCEWSLKVKATDFRAILLNRPPEPTLKIDLVRDAGAQFGEQQRFASIVVDSMLNIAVNKVTAVFGRTAAKDFVDLYFLLQRGFDLDELMQMAKEKDLGFSEFYFAGSLGQIRRVQDLPRMIQPVTLEELRAFFQPLAEQIMLKLKPRV